MRLSKVALQVGGCIMIATGLFAATIAPLEFSLFKNWPKNLVGFGYLGFAALSGQIFGFYLVAVVLVPLGYGHLLLRPWAHKLTMTALWAWLIVGSPCVALVTWIFVASKDPTDLATLAFGAFVLLFYPVLPSALILFYRSPKTRAQFQTHANRSAWIATAPQPVLILGTVVAFYVLRFTRHSS